MADFDTVVDELVTKFGGGRPLEQGEGDSFGTGFARGLDAVGCALEIQKQIADGPLRVRMALHTGEVEVRDQPATTIRPSFARRAFAISDAAGTSSFRRLTETWPPPLRNGRLTRSLSK